MNPTKCPHCGQDHSYCVNCGEPLGDGGQWAALLDMAKPTPKQAAPPGRGWSTMRPMQSVAPWGSPPPQSGGAYTAYRKTPARPPSLAADVATPVGKGLAVGIAAAALAILPAALLQGWPWYTPLITLGAVGPVAVVGFIFHHQSHLWNYEEVTQEGEPIQPAQPQAPPPVALEVIQKTEGGAFEKMLRFELPAGITEADFYTLAKGITEGGRGLALTDWTGSGRPFSRANYGELLSKLTAAGIIELINPTAPAQGRRLTRRGRQALLTWVATYEK